MLTHELTRTATRVAPEDLSALTTLMAEEEAPLSDAPLYSPEDFGGGLLVLGLLLSPKPPKDR
ncbi:hypothetical protein [Streptacidiphilus sp. P02-A3a]|uniref:hypothetical protein n=1 Tax=Streptacidiphilus sp. P02-A3a TaxID=2704468 RepID=UPI0015FCCB41|nr:hypothetical protein [Streptacidiphilus sp. P02-A3a]QMU69549.1 hypothetical protein GXP74_16205 [Streptacidiphilus sp. P02-A3a]